MSMGECLTCPQPFFCVVLTKCITLNVQYFRKNVYDKGIYVFSYFRKISQIIEE